MDISLILSKIKIHKNFTTDAEFAKFLEITPQTISSWKSRNSFNLELIYKKCPELNTEWLITGEGEMLKSENSSTVIQGRNKNNIVNSTVSSEQDTSELVNMIKILENQLKIKDEQINKLIEKIGK